jgi:hypothetical protein
MTHLNNILYYVHTGEKTTESVTIVTIWGGPRMQRSQERKPIPLAWRGGGGGEGFAIILGKRNVYCFEGAQTVSTCPSDKGRLETR